MNCKMEKEQKQSQEQGGEMHSIQSLGSFQNLKLKLYIVSTVKTSNLQAIQDKDTILAELIKCTHSVHKVLT